MRQEPWARPAQGGPCRYPCSGVCWEVPLWAAMALPPGALCPGCGVPAGQLRPVDAPEQGPPCSEPRSLPSSPSLPCLA